LYEILSVAPGAGEEEVRAAFHRVSKAAHPDTGGSDELFCQVKDAYDTLSDPTRRAEYDRSLKAASVTSGEAAQVEATGPVISVTGTLTIPGAAGGTATIAVAIARVLGVGVGIVTVSDPGAHVETGAVVLNRSLTRTATGQVSGTASGLRGVGRYALHFTV
jgi:hypothetical protein